MSSLKSCPEGTEPNPNPNRGKGTRRCLKVCKENEYRDENFNCVSKHKKTRKIKIVDGLAKRVIPNETKEESKQRAIDAANSIRAAKSMSKIPESDGPPPQSKIPTRQSAAPCDEYSRLLEQRKGLNANISKKNAECEDEKFKDIQRYFDYDVGVKHTHRDLLIALQKLYIDIKNKDINSILTFSNFVQMFPRDTMTTNKFKRQHVFEAMCRLLLLFDYDDGELGRGKHFYKSLEQIVKNTDLQPNLDKDEILEAKINESSKGGVADIVFQTEYKELKHNLPNYDETKRKTLEKFLNTRKKEFENTLTYNNKQNEAILKLL
jgi:hypothetical protein